MLFFYRYQDMKLMLTQQMMAQYSIQFEMIKMIIIQNIDEMLKKQSNRQNKSTINQIAGDLKLQFRILQDHINIDEEGQIQIVQSLKAMYQLIKKLDYHSIVLTQKHKQNFMNVQLLYLLMENYQDRIEVIEWDQIYRLILIYQGKHFTIPQSQTIQQPHLGLIIKQSSRQHPTTKLIITNEYLKFKIDMSHLCFQKNKIKFGQQLLKQVLIYQPPWISTQIIKIMQSSSIQNFNDSFMKIAFEYCLKGDDLAFLIKIWKNKKIMLKNNNSNKQNIFKELLDSTQKYMITDDTYVLDQKQYRNHVAEMSFNDDLLKSKDYVMFFTLLGTEPFRAFYLICSKNLDIVKIQIFLKQGMKLGILHQVSIIKIFVNLLYFMIQAHKTKLNKHHKFRVSYLNFKSLNTIQITSRIQKQKYFDQTNKQIKQSVPFIMLKKLFKPVKSILLLPHQFIQNYICNFLVNNSYSTTTQFSSLYNFLYDQNHRSKHLLSLKDQPMGKNDIKLFYQLCQINNLNIIDLVLFNLTNKLNTTQSNNTQLIHQDQAIQNMLQKIVTWTENNEELSSEILQKLINKLFSSKMLYEIVCYLQQRENVIFKKLITQSHLKIIQSVSLIQISTELHGLIPETFFHKAIQPNPKQHLSQKHVKLLKKQLKLYNVFIISKVLYFCYGLSNEIQKQVLKIFLKENQGKQNDKKKQFEQLKNKLYQINQIYKQ